MGNEPKKDEQIKDLDPKKVDKDAMEADSVRGGMKLNDPTNKTSLK